MTTSAATPWGNEPVPLRRRRDLVVRPSFAAPGRAWLVKDPVALRYYELPEEERFLWQQLDGQTSWTELRERYERAFAPKRLDAARLLNLVEDLHRRGLVTSDRDGQGATLRERARRLRREAFWNRFANPLAIRLPGFNPQPLLARGLPWLAPLFTRGFAVAYAATCLWAIVAAVIHFDDLRRELSHAAGRFPAVDDWPLWIAAIIGAKIVHESAHAATARRFGGETPELGVLLLCGLPCLYCDVSSMWMVPERWKRLVVGAGGMLAEIGLAATALLLWRASEPGLFHAFCLHLAVVCSVGTIVVNANPLLRYDGYFILADLVGMTNLGERADAALRSVAAEWFVGESYVDERREPRRLRRRLALYALASTAYRLALTFGVLWLVRGWLVPRGLALVADLVTVLVIGGVLFGPLRRAATFARTVRHGERDARRRFFLRATAFACLAAALLLWPWPYRVDAPAVVRLEEAEYLYVVAGGALADGAQLGATVAPGQVVARLDDPELQLDVRRLEADVARRRLEIANLERRRVADPAQGNALPAARELLAVAERQLAQRRRELTRLAITTGRGGVVVPLFPERADDADDDARVSPLDPRRRGAFLAPGTPLCAVGDPTRWEADVAVDQRQIEFVRRGQAVRLRFEALPGRTFTGRVVEIATVDADAHRHERPAATTTPEVRYHARVAIDHPADAPLPIGAVGRAKIDADRQSLWSRFRRALEATFRLS